MAQFASSTRNAGDLLLWPALRDVEHGFYITLGTDGPEPGSAMAAFHQHGWRGLNVEPDAAVHERLCRSRPDDINLCLALATSEFPAATPSGTAATRLLRDLCAEYVRGPIHVLRIGARTGGDVLLGADFSRWRPWLVMVGTTAPSGPAAWEATLLRAGYHLVRLDGPNRVYAADEMAARLDPHFSISAADGGTPPPHPEADVTAAHAELGRLRDRLQARTEERDGWMQAYFEASRHAAALAQERQDLVERLEALAPYSSNVEQALARSQTEVEQLKAALPLQQEAMQRQAAELAAERQAAQVLLQQLAALRASGSWRLTRPLRVLRRLLAGRRA